MNIRRLNIFVLALWFTLVGGSACGSKNHAPFSVYSAQNIPAVATSVKYEVSEVKIAQVGTIKRK